MSTSPPRSDASNLPQETPLPVVARVSRVVTGVVDRIMGDRVEYPLMVAAACVEALKLFQIQSRVYYGPAAWIEILEDHSPIWAGSWGKSLHFWVGTAWGETVDLNVSVAFRKRSHDRTHLKAIHSPPLLWSKEVPLFYRYMPEGVAELELTDPEDQRKYALVLAEILEKCDPRLLLQDEEFLNEPVLCSNRKLLDDSLGSFKLFDRALSVHGLPEPPRIEHSVQDR